MSDELKGMFCLDHLIKEITSLKKKNKILRRALKSVLKEFKDKDPELNEHYLYESWIAALKFK